LSGWQRAAFATVFALMMAFVVAATVSAAKSSTPQAADRAGPSGGRASSQPAAQLEPVQALGQAATQAPWHHPSAAAHRARLNRQLAAALRAVLRGRSGHIAVGVIDVGTGARAVFDGGRHFHTASIEKADILAALLLDHQEDGTQLTGQEASLAMPMIEDSDNDAATDLSDMVDGNAGIADANARLRLTHTVMGPRGYWGLTSTTVADQLQLLIDLTARRSPLTAASRDYEVGLMESVAPGQAWGVSAAASAGTSYAIKNGWLPDPLLWVTNSIGVVQHDGQQLLIVVLADDQPSEAAGISADSAAARAAAAVIIRAP
jgi:hypothetical protein